MYYMIVTYHEAIYNHEDFPDAISSSETDIE